MSEYKEEFEYDFAIRTAYNLKHIIKAVESEKKKNLKESEYKLYEVTQLINSFIGLLVIPKEHFFNNLDENSHFKEGSLAANILTEFNSGMRVYDDTYLDKIDSKKYRKKSEKKLTEKILIIRLRNAVSHGYISVNAVSESNEIESVCFGDKQILKGKWNSEKTEFNVFNKKWTEKYKQEFSIALSVKDIEILLFAICKILIESDPNGKSKWPKELN